MSAKLSVSPASGSMPVSVPETVPPSSTEATAPLEVGASLMPVVVITRLALLLRPAPSVTVYGTVSVRVWPVATLPWLAASKLQFPATSSVKPAGAVPVSAKLSVSPASASVAVSVPATVPSSSTEAVAPVVTGASLVPVIVTVTVAVVVSPAGSVTV